MRRKVRAAQEQLQKLLIQRERLLRSSKEGKPLVPVAALTSEDTAGAPGDINGTDGKAILHQAVTRLEELSDTIDDPERQKSQAILIQKLKSIMTLMQNQIGKLNNEISQVREQIAATRQLNKKDIGPYQLRTVIMWNGFMGRDSMYTYVRSGTASAEIDGVTIKNPKWWKISSDGTFEVSFDDVLSDKTGMHMPGAGSIAQSYVLAEAEEAEEEDLSSLIPHGLLEAMDADNTAYWALVHAPPSNSGPRNDTTSQEASEGVVMDSTPAHSKDETMQTDEAVKAEVEDMTKGTLNLKGGASRRRMSVSSDTGSIASTSRVRLDDWDDEGDEEFAETVELGFPVKMKKGFKVVKDVGKIGGKPVSTAL